MTIRRLSRWFATVCVCALVFLASLPLSPAFAGVKSDPTDGPAQLDESLKAAEKVAESAPMSMQEVQARSQRGLNEVQADADMDEMIPQKHPDQPGPAILKDIKHTLDLGK